MFGGLFRFACVGIGMSNDVSDLFKFRTILNFI